MGKTFDPYHQWLGIKPKDQPADHYRLLGIERFEDDAEVIENAADRQTMLVRTFQSGAHSETSQQILNELAAARICLLNPEKKSTYDAKLRAKQPAAASPVRVAAQPIAARPVQTTPPASESNTPTADQAFQLTTTNPGSLSRRGRQQSSAAGPMIGVLVAAGLAIVAWLMLSRPSDDPSLAQSATPSGKKNTSAAPPPTSSNPRPVGQKDEAVPHDRPADPSSVDSPSTDTPARGATGGAPSDSALLAGRTPVVDNPTDESPGTQPTGAESPVGTAPPSLPSETTTPEEPTLGPRPPRDDTDPAESSTRETTKAPTRQAVPTAAERKKTQALVRELYAAQYQAANEPDGRRALADTLMAQAEQTVDDSAAQFVLLLEAAAADLATPDRTVATAAIERLVATFQVATEAVEKVALRQAAQVADTPGRAAVVQSALAMVATAVARDAFDHAHTLLEEIEPVAQRTRQRDLIKQVRTTLADVATRREAFDAHHRVLATLERNPTDAAAHYAAAQYLIDVKDDWPAGLRHWEKTGEAPLAKLAARDLQGADSPTEQVELAEQWWTVSQATESPRRETLLRRARHWYQEAGDALSGLAQVQAQQRLRQISQQLGEPVEIPGLVAHWPLDSGRGNAVREKQHGAEAPFHGSLAWVKDRKTQVLGFPGGEDYLDMPPHDFGDQFTLALWMQPVAKNSINCVLANREMNRFGGRFGGGRFGRFGGRGFGDRDFGRRRGFALYFNPGQSPAGALTFSTTGSDDSETATTAGNVLAAGRWSHVAVAVDRPNGAAGIFVNGRLATNNAQVARDFDTDGQWRVGAFTSDDEARHSYKGLLADLRIYNRVLSSQEIAELASK